MTARRLSLSAAVGSPLWAEPRNGSGEPVRGRVRRRAGVVPRAVLRVACGVRQTVRRGPVLGNGAGHGGPTKRQHERETSRPVAGGGAPSFLRRLALVPWEAHGTTGGVRRDRMRPRPPAALLQTGRLAWLSESDCLPNIANQPSVEAESAEQ